MDVSQTLMSLENMRGAFYGTYLLDEGKSGGETGYEDVEMRYWMLLLIYFSMICTRFLFLLHTASVLSTSRIDVDEFFHNSK